MNDEEIDKMLSIPCRGIGDIMQEIKTYQIVCKLRLCEGCNRQIGSMIHLPAIDEIPASKVCPYCKVIQK